MGVTLKLRECVLCATPRLEVIVACVALPPPSLAEPSFVSLPELGSWAPPVYHWVVGWTYSLAFLTAQMVTAKLRVEPQTPLGPHSHCEEAPQTAAVVLRVLCCVFCHCSFCLASRMVGVALAVLVYSEAASSPLPPSVQRVLADDSHRVSKAVAAYGHRIVVSKRLG